jgi:hypothetical protein
MNKEDKWECPECGVKVAENKAQSWNVITNTPVCFGCGIQMEKVVIKPRKAKEVNDVLDDTEPESKVPED